MAKKTHEKGTQGCDCSFSKQSCNLFKSQRFDVCGLWRFTGLFVWQEFWAPHVCLARCFSCCRNPALKTINSRAVKLHSFFQWGLLLRGLKGTVLGDSEESGLWRGALTLMVWMVRIASFSSMCPLMLGTWLLVGCALLIDTGCRIWEAC